MPAVSEAAAAGELRDVGKGYAQRGRITVKAQYAQARGPWSLPSVVEAYKLFILYYLKATMNKHPSSDARSVGTSAAQSLSMPAEKAVATKAAAKKSSSATKAAPSKKVSAAKNAAKAATRAPAESSKPEAVGKPAKKAAKLRPQLVRDSFTMPEEDFELIAVLKSKALDARRAAKKSELLRAGLRLLSALEAKVLVAALDKLEPVKIGRPKKGH